MTISIDPMIAGMSAIKQPSQILPATPGSPCSTNERDAQRHLALRRTADDVEPHLPAWSFAFYVRFPGGQMLGQLDAMRTRGFRIAVSAWRMILMLSTTSSMRTM